MAFQSTRSSRRLKNNRAEDQQQKSPFFSKASDTVQTKSEGAFFQPKSASSEGGLTIGQPNDSYEKEADSVADAVVNNTSQQPAIQQKEISSIQRTTLATPLEDEKLSTAEDRMKRDKLIQEKPELQKMDHEEEEGNVQMKSQNGGGNAASTQVSHKIKSKAGKGQKLPPKTKAAMESGFGVGFGQVNVHTDTDAIQMNKKLGAQAFTHGNDIYFNKGKFNEDSSAGKRLLAHELTHVVQQNQNQIKKKPGEPSKASKTEKKREEIFKDYSRGSHGIDPKILKRAKSAMSAFSLQQLRLMQKAGLRFWTKGGTISYPIPNIDVKLGTGGKANYSALGRVIGLNNGSGTNDIRHEIAHAWDHIQKISKKDLIRLEKMNARHFERWFNKEIKLVSTSSKALKAAYNRYVKRLGGGPKKRPPGESLRNLAFGNVGTKEGYSTKSIKEFYAEGYSVFHGHNDNQKARLLMFAPELYTYLEKEAKKQGLKSPDKKKLHKMKDN